MGYRYRLHAKELPSHPDIVFRPRHKVIFVHGCFWHLHKNCPKCRLPKSRSDYWQPKLERNAERDREARRLLKRIGWRSLVVWECEIAQPERLARKLRRFLGRYIITRHRGRSDADSCAERKLKNSLNLQQCSEATEMQPCQAQQPGAHWLATP